MRTRIWHSDWKPRWLIRCVSAAVLSFMDKQEKIYIELLKSLSPADVALLEILMVDPDPEAGQIPVPKHRVPFDHQCRHGAVGEGLLLHCHRRFPSRRLGTARHDVGANAAAGPGGGRLFGVAHQVSVFRGGADPGVTEQPADHRQALAERQRPLGVGMAEIVNSHVLQSGVCADAAPGLLQIGDVGAR